MFIGLVLESGIGHVCSSGGGREEGARERGVGGERCDEVAEGGLVSGCDGDGQEERLDCPCGGGKNLKESLSP